jgi:ubiquinone/menaquinone biosynthesis C-methylase UbiE
MEQQVALQRRYYAETADRYDEIHLADADEHGVALGWLTSLIRLYGIESLLDVGCGTGRCLLALKNEAAAIRAVGVEPVGELREIALRHGLGPEQVLDGDALALPFGDQSFDVVSAFGILHHIKDSQAAVREMCRVARKAIFISDSNNFGQGSAPVRALKQAMKAAGLWSAFDFIRTKGKGYYYSEGDGVYYSYSVLSAVPTLKTRFKSVRLMSTGPSGANLYRTAGHIAIFASQT